MTTDGKVVDPVIEDSSGSRNFEKAALRVVDDWIFEPATWDGDPVEQCHSETMVSFAIEGGSPGASPRFARQYKRIVDRINNGEIQEAEKLVDETFASWRLSGYELSRLWMLRGIIARETDQRALELSSFRKAVANGGLWLEQDVYRSLLSDIVALELFFGDYSAALDNYEKLVNAGAATEYLGKLPDAIASVNDILASPKTFAVPASLSAGRQCEDCPADWQYNLLRRKFSFAAIQGSLDRLEIHCDFRRVVDTPREGVDWNIPASWGNCQIIVSGDSGTSFSLLEQSPST